MYLGTLWISVPQLA
jgi:hypothetical protein